MSNIPTAEKFANGMLGKEQYPTDTLYCMIEFAKLHLKAQAEAICENVEINGNVPQDWVNKNSILDAYPLENIK